MLQINNVDAYYGDVQVLSQINFEVNEGEVVTIVGANGAGKSTTINAISGLLAPRRGKIYFQGESIGGMKPHKIVEKGIIQVPEGRRIFPEMTVH